MTELVAMLARYEAVNSNQKRALNSARVAADQFKKCLEDGKTYLSVCKLRDADGNLIFAGSSKAIVPPPPIVQQHPVGAVQHAVGASSTDRSGGGIGGGQQRSPANARYRADAPPRPQPPPDEYNEEHSQGSQTLLELAGASQVSQISLTSQISLSGFPGLMNSQEVDEPPPHNSQESAHSRHSSDDSHSPQRPDPSDPSDQPSRRSNRRPAPTEKAEEAGLRSKRPKLDEQPGASPTGSASSPAGAPPVTGAAIWPPAPVTGATRPPVTLPPPPELKPAVGAPAVDEEPMGSQEQLSALELLGSQCSVISTSPMGAAADVGVPRAPSPLACAPPQQAVA